MEWRRRAALSSAASRVGRTVRVGGFTLIELLSVVSVLAVVAALAVPGMRSFAAGQRVKALAYDMTADLLLARSEALKRNRIVSIAASGATWASGWTVSDGAEKISTRNVDNDSLSFSPRDLTVITFDVNGRVTVPATPVRMSVYPSAAAASAATNDSSNRCIELDLSGRARSLVGACTP